MTVNNFLWVDDEACDRVAAHELAHASGQFALHQRDGDEHVLARDPLGVNKLFFAISAGGDDVVSSSYLIDLRRAGFALADIWSVPSGHVAHIDPRRRTLTLEKYAQLTFDDGAPDASLEGALAQRASAISARLKRVFDRIARRVRDRPLYVTMSGGLDSTGIATLARERLGEFVGVTFCLDGDDAPGSDVFAARKVAEHLGVPLEVVSLSSDEIARLLDTVLVHGQDWRDFNVHCGVVNAALAEAIARRSADRPVVLTGDTMNELMADYAPVSYRGVEYYPLPRLPAGTLRRFLVGGLDSGDREVGIFSHYGIDVIQPYALCADAYAAIPGALLEQPQAKQRLAERVFGERIPRFVYERPKVRAQAAGAEVGGTLAALVDRGFDSRALLERFCALFDIDPGEPARLIRAGFYRFPTSYPSSSRSIA